MLHSTFPLPTKIWSRVKEIDPLIRPCAFESFGKVSRDACSSEISEEHSVTFQAKLIGSRSAALSFKLIDNTLKDIRETTADACICIALQDARHRLKATEYSICPERFFNTQRKLCICSLNEEGTLKTFKHRRRCIESSDSLEGPLCLCSNIRSSLRRWEVSSPGQGP